jgi:conserved oligomeric Golgi complex subunit 4
VQQAIASRDLELASQHIQRFLQYSEEPIQSIFQKTSTIPADSLEQVQNPSDDPLGLLGPSPVSILQRAHAVVANMVSAAFEESIKAGNAEDITKYFKLFPLIGKHELGLDKFAKYIGTNISRTCQQGMKVAIEQSKLFCCIDMSLHPVLNPIRKQDDLCRLVDIAL